MSKEEKNEESKEIKTEETTESKVNTEETKPIVEESIEGKVEGVGTDTILEEIRKMSKTYQETLDGLTEKLKDTQKKLEEFEKEAKAKEPIRVTAIVKGKYDFTQKVAEMGHKSIKDYETHCREVYDRINNAYPTVNRLS